MSKIVVMILCTSFLITSCDKVGEIIDEGKYEKPIIESFEFIPNKDINIRDTVMAIVTATNPEKGILAYKWHDDPENSGRFIDPTDNDTAFWIALSPGNAEIIVTVSNDKDESQAKPIKVITPTNPVVNILTPKENEFIVQNSSVSVTGTADHANNINHIRLFVDDILKDEIAVDKASVDFSFSFVADSTMISETTIRVDAESQQAGTTGSDFIVVSVEGILPKRGGN